jgi:hypothetical protein
MHQRTTENPVLDFPLTLDQAGLLNVHLLPQEDREEDLSTCTLGSDVKHVSTGEQGNPPVVRA